MRNEGADVIPSGYRMDGLELLVACKGNARGAHRVLMTAYPDAHVAVRAVNEARIERFLTKPFEPEALRAMVEEMFPRPAGAA